MSNRPDTSKELAALLTGGEWATSHRGTTVQRSHRFPFHLYCKIRNISDRTGMAESAVINQLITAGLETLEKQLPENVVYELAEVPLSMQATDE